MPILSKKSSKKDKVKYFGTFQGVFTPTVLTILGVIMYIRHPWVVGNAGVVGAMVIVAISVAITLFTSLSMASMTTNIRIESGGAFSIISQSLGLEIGGSIGIPLYLAQACVVAMYIFGFREGWLWIFPDHNPLIIDILTFGVIALIAGISTDVAFKIQYVIMAIIAGSIVSIVAGAFQSPLDLEQLNWFGSYEGEPIIDASSGAIMGFKPATFWTVFAVFFPAVTGIMAGVNMSGELSNPRKSIPQGTLIAVVLTGIIYLLLILVASVIASPYELVSDYYIFIDKAFWKPIVVAGLLGATFSSALSSMVGAPRILLALGQKNILPKSTFFSKVSATGEPRNAIYFSMVIVIISLLFRNLNAIAPLITMFFLITYAMINVVVLIEQSLGLPSFRPMLKVPIIIPLIGTAGCLLVMFIINSTISLISLAIVVAFYAVLINKVLIQTKGDVRSGLFTAIANWATKISSELSPTKEARAWQPELLVPIESAKEVKGAYRLIYALTYPKGSVKVLGMMLGGEEERLRLYLPKLMDSFRKANISSSYTLVDGEDFGKTVSISMQALETAFFKPNTIFLKLDENKHGLQEKYMPIILETKKRNWGLVLLATFEGVGFGIEKTINVWLDIVPENWESTLNIGNNDLAILTALIIRKNWDAKINIIKTRREESPLSEKEIFAQLEQIKVLARMPQDTQIRIVMRTPDMWGQAPLADLNILELPNKEGLDLRRLQEIPNKLRTACLFTLDSNVENALI
ncbi:Na-K-Cl cotransporter [Flavobacteriaceae bacterium TP-CH-4]|uniref:Na-K-Cl cotransporter n=1 Tax=Pelagihabitans pacificus TaxID=2696054 RepID=A0A967ARU8_9FLAO|nr:amino acid permease [Pelagihabitans pacificus]NHF58837.1 Na-K-Cl cotransporter [Pelagihabitans pacificus]